MNIIMGGGGGVIIGETAHHTLAAWLDFAMLKVRVFRRCLSVSYSLYDYSYVFSGGQI